MVTVKDLRSNLHVVETPPWWFFDSTAGILYFEKPEWNRNHFHSEPARIIPSDQEFAWIGLTDAGDQYLLWQDKEISLNNHGVSAVKAWGLRGYRGKKFDRAWSAALYIALLSGLAWRSDNPDLPTVYLSGYHADTGIRFFDTIRIVIPQAYGPFVAISDKGLSYILQ